MLRLKARGTGAGWAGVIFIVLLAVTATILWIAQPVAANAEPVSFGFTASDGDHTIAFDLVDGKISKVKVDGRDGEAKKAGNIKKYRSNAASGSTAAGNYVVFDGSTCVFVAGHWISVPPGGKCP